MKQSLLSLAIAATVLAFTAPVRADHRSCHMQTGSPTEANRLYFQCQELEKLEHVQMKMQERRIRAMEEATEAQQSTAQAQRDAAWAARRQAEAAERAARAQEQAAQAAQQAAEQAAQNARRPVTCRTQVIGYGKTRITCD